MSDFLQPYSLSGNWVDLVLLAIIIIFIFSSSGFIESFFELLGLIASLFISFKFYPSFAQAFIHYFYLSRGISFALGFFFVWVLSESVIFILTLVALSRFFHTIRTSSWNRVFRFIPSTLHALTIYLFFTCLIFSLPVSGPIKSDMLESRTGPFFIRLAQSLESIVKPVFSGAITESLNFLTIKPKSNEMVSLGFTVPDKKMFPDPASEKIMFDLINKERVSDHQKPLEEDENLRVVARRYAKQLFEYGFFSHASIIDGSTALERATREGIIFQVIGENLAYAPDVYLAHQGLMNSKGHRENILSVSYERVGIGIIDAGVYGRMFVQVFTD